MEEAMGHKAARITILRVEASVTSLKNEMDLPEKEDPMIEINKAIKLF